MTDRKEVQDASVEKRAEMAKEARKTVADFRSQTESKISVSEHRNAKKVIAWVETFNRQGESDV